MYRLLILSFIAVSCVCRAECIDSLLVVLDQTIDESEKYEIERCKRIDQINIWLSNPEITEESEYKLNSKMYDEYESYVCDSAWKYVNRNIQLATKKGRTDWLRESNVKKAHVLATGGLFTESVSLLKSMSPFEMESDEMKALYYKCLSDAYLYQTENNEDNEYYFMYNDLCRQYSDSALLYVKKGSYLELITLAPELVKDGKIAQSIELLQNSLVDYPTDSHERSVVYSLMSFAYYCSSDFDRQMECLIRSALSDIRSVVMENRALREVSEILYKKGDLERANKYLKKSLSDATKFNSRLRNMQSSKMLPVIDAAYQKQKEEQQTKMKRYMWIISLLSVLILLAMAYIYRQMNKLSSANSKLKDLNNEFKDLNGELVRMNDAMTSTNGQLRELNHIKEEYVGRFMELCTIYIAEFDSFRKKLHKASGSTKVSDMQRLLSSDESVEAILKEFYKTFDKSFLNLFPDFVESVNCLFPEEYKIELKSNDRFNTEVRILSLIRLGITDSEKIASFLRCSITTIYTYRSKMKNRSLCPDDFEAQVMAIGYDSV